MKFSNYIFTTILSLSYVTLVLSQSRGGQIQGYQQQLLSLVNLHRATLGAKALCFVADLNIAAQKHSDDMAAIHQMSHTGSDGSDPFQRMKRAGYSTFQSAAENVAFGSIGGALAFETAAAVFKGWLDSPPHRENIENAAFNQMGAAFSIGKCPGFGGKCAYWTQNFGAADAGLCSIKVSNNPIKKLINAIPKAILPSTPKTILPSTPKTPSANTNPKSGVLFSEKNQTIDTPPPPSVNPSPSPLQPSQPPRRKKCIRKVKKCKPRSKRSYGL